MIPCYVSTGILSESFEDGNEEKLRQWGLLYQNILQGYDSVNPLSAKEKEALPYIVFSIQMICVAYFSGVGKICGAGRNQPKDAKTADHTQGYADTGIKFRKRTAFGETPGLPF